MAGTIVVDRLESDASYASSINIASPIVISNTITGNVNIDNGTLFVNQINNRVGIGGITNPSNFLDVNTSISITENGVASANTDLTLFSRFSDNQRGYVTLKAESNSSGSSDLVIRSRNNFSEAERFRIDSVGRVMNPNQPGFYAWKDDGNTGTSGTIVYNNVRWNVGSGYNNTNGRFTAPVSGYYIMGCTGISAAGNYVESGIYQNGTTMLLNVRGQGVVGGSTQAGCGGACIHYLNANDYLIVAIAGSAAQYGFGPYTTFFARLIG